MRKVVVIGAGISGLAIAIRMAVRGFTVTVYEKAGHYGGKIASLSHNGFRFDTGPSLFVLPGLVSELFILAGKNCDEYLTLQKLPSSCNYFFPDGTNLKSWSDPEKFCESVRNAGMNPDVIEKYLHRQAFLYNHTSDFFLFNSIHKLKSYYGAAGIKSLKALHLLGAFKTMHQMNSQAFGLSPLTQLFDRYATYNGSDPYRAPATLNMIAHLEHNTGAYFPANGMKGIVDALYLLACELGVGFKFNEAVTRLKTCNMKVTRVVTQNGESIADIVVNATDITSFYKNLLRENSQLKKLSGRERSSSALIFYWGVNLQTDLDLHNILFSSDYKAEFKGLFQRKELADDLTVYIFISKKIVDTDAPSGKENWFVMVNAPENTGQDWQAQTHKARRIILEKIRNRLGIDLNELIEQEYVITPVDIERNTSSVNGSLYGHSSNSAIAAFLRHPNFSRKFRNLYFVGGSVHPGGGIPLCLASAKITDQLIR